MKVLIKETPYDTQINTTIKPIDKEDSNAELEKGEVVFDQTALTLHKVLGKRHSAGGTPVNLNSNAFIFSDFKKLKIKDKDAEIMEFKKGGTPAKILTKEVDIKHHNTMVDMLRNQKGDEVSNNSAELMLKKNMDKVGQVAFLQEEKKRFPQGQPEFSQGTAPVYSRNIDEEIMKSKQYEVGGPFKGGMFMKALDFECPWGRDANGQCLPKPQNANSSLADPYYKKAPLVQQVPNNYNLIDSRGNSSLYSNSTAGASSGKMMSNDQWKRYLANETPAQKQRRLTRQSAQGQDNFVRTENTTLTGKTTAPPLLTIPAGTPKPVLAPRTPGVPPVSSTDPDLPVVANYPKIGLTDYQKLDMGRQAIEALSIKKYRPVRQQQESVITQPELFSAQPYLNQINQGYFNAANNLKSLTSPSQLIAANRELYGNRLDQSNKVIGDIENQNVSLLNTSKLNNANTLNADAVANRGFDEAYLDKSNTVDANYDNLYGIAKNNLANNFNETIAETQAMQNMINSQRALKTDVPIYDKNGKQTGWEGQLPILPQKGFFGYTTRYNPNISAEALLNYNSGSSQNSTQTQQMLISAIAAEKAAIDSETDPRTRAIRAQNYTRLITLLYNPKTK